METRYNLILLLWLIIFNLFLSTQFYFIIATVDYLVFIVAIFVADHFNNLIWII